MRLLAILLTGCWFIAGCQASQSTQTSPSKAVVPISLDTTQTLTTIAFGSCNKTTEPQPLWSEIINQQPDLWIWLGDNVYGDTPDMKLMQQKYQQQLQKKGYQKLLASTSVVGIWDDHDYGINDGGKYFAQRAASRDLMLEFLQVDASRPVWQREGGYQSYTFGPEGKKVKVILLDTRYFRDTLMESSTEGKRYGANPQGDMLGEAQWAWLTEELNSSDAQFNIIGSSIQVIHEEHGYEKWANFPKSHQRLYDLITNSEAKGVVLLSGDRHIGEISRLKLPEMPYPLYDITSSGMTHVYEDADEENRHRVSDLVTKLNYGLIQIDWNTNQVTYQVKGENRATYASETVVYPF
ncbi:alkaline phosphatase D family protein [Tunicatimonas pelagia]|uniref:alkaline phosphatase D family protein n=1 Tax=Tunicatimonas pelagia TaxID=931531 RepID=UPI0026656A25|nr:alkaline phosphatase D family protein [Tunicatimonas pelagia]WKN42047.1 alkaline phosphatase D family protein [Tunicatimonas pelagia]